MRTNKEIAAFNRRRDTGSGQYWIPLHSQALELFFSELLEDILNALGDDIETGIVNWNKEVGIATVLNSSLFYVLVTDEKGMRELYELIDEFGSVDSIMQKLATLDHGERQALRKIIVSTFSKNVRVARWIPPAELAGPIAANNFKETHIGGQKIISFAGKEIQTVLKYPKYTLISDNTVDTGQTRLTVRSVPTAEANEDIPGSHPGVRPKSEVLAIKKAAQKGGKKFFSRSAARLASIGLGAPGGENKDPVVDPYNQNNPPRPLVYYQSVNRDGTVETYQPGPERKPPAFSVGGRSNVRIDTASQIVNGTNRQSYIREQQINNPLGFQAGSFFSPRPQFLSTLFAPISSVLKDPAILIGIVSMIALNEKGNNKNYYFTNYKNLPLQIIDNNDLEKELFGE